jgi:rubrerythrin
MATIAFAQAVRNSVAAEQAAARFYTLLAESTDDASARTFLEEMAAQEVRHAEAIEELGRKMDAGDLPPRADENVELIETAPQWAFVDNIPLAQALQLAVDLEIQAALYYDALADASPGALLRCPRRCEPAAGERFLPQGGPDRGRARRNAAGQDLRCVSLIGGGGVGQRTRTVPDHRGRDNSIGSEGFMARRGGRGGPKGRSPDSAGEVYYEVTQRGLRYYGSPQVGAAYLLAFLIEEDDCDGTIDSIEEIIEQDWDEGHQVALEWLLDRGYLVECSDPDPSDEDEDEDEDEASEEDGDDEEDWDEDGDEDSDEDWVDEDEEEWDEEGEDWSDDDDDDDDDEDLAVIGDDHGSRDGD